MKNQIPLGHSHDLSTDSRLSRHFLWATLLCSMAVSPLAREAHGDPLSSGAAGSGTAPAASWVWRGGGRLNNPRSNHTAALLPDGKVLVAGGADGGPLASAELYDPATNRWSFTGSLHTTRQLHTATSLQNGMVLVAAGQSNGVLSGSAELYDPASGSWTVTGSLNTARQMHTATLLQNGMVLVTGGQDSSGFTASAELYDPASGSWTVTGSLTFARVWHTATRLANGMVLESWRQAVSMGVSSAPRLANYTTRRAGRGLSPAASLPRALDTLPRC